MDSSHGGKHHPSPLAALSSQQHPSAEDAVLYPCLHWLIQDFSHMVITWLNLGLLSTCINPSLPVGTWETYLSHMGA
jgi:hypothetical protein